MRRLLVAVGAAALLTLPASAGATVTASSVDTTGGPFFDHNSDGAGLVISGHVTSDDTAADKVKLVCQGYGGQFLGPGSTGIPIAPDGSVSVDVGNNLDFWYCNARFVPFSAPAPPGPYDAAFVPTPIGVLSRNDIKFPPPNDNGVYDWYQSASGPLAYADGDSLGDCPLYTTYTIASNFGYTQLFGDCIGPYDPSDTSTSSITLDGVPTLTPYFASTYPVDSVPLITDLQRNIDHATGEVSVAGTEPLTLCAPGCLAPTSAHAHVEHSFHVDHGGRLVTLVDVWHNDRDVPVTLDVGYVFRLNGATAQWKLPGQADFADIPDGDLGAPAPGPGFVSVLHDPGDADGADTSARGTVAWSTPPDSMTGVAAIRGVVLHYHRTIPAGGALRILFAAATTKAQADADQLAAGVVAATKPAIAMTAPDDGSTTSAATTTVTGTSSDDGGPPAVKVNGVDATVAGDGSWTANVPLTIGANAITATGTDADGNAATASRSVTRAQPPSPPPPSSFAATLKNVKLKQGKDGTLTVTVTVNAPGKLSGSLSRKAGKKTKAIARAKRTVRGAGTVKLKLKPSKATRKLLRKRSLKSTLKLSFTAQGSTAKTTKKVKLKRLKR